MWVPMPSRALPTEPRQPRAHLTRQRLLDAAVEELVEQGYVGLTAAGVAARAGVSRGAQQNYFPHRTTLVSEAVRHLGSRQIEEIGRAVAQAPGGGERVKALLDIVYEQCGGPLFAVIVELSLAARGEPELHEIVVSQERAISRALRESATEIFGAEVTATRAFAQRWGTALAAARGLALLKLMGRPPDVVDRAWARSTRPELIALLRDWWS